MDKEKLARVKAYLTEQDLTDEESGDLAAWLFLTGVGSAIKKALG